MTSEWHIRMRVGFILRIIHLKGLHSVESTLDIRVAWAIVESPDVRIEKVALRAAKQINNLARKTEPKRTTRLCCSPEMGTIDCDIPELQGGVERQKRSLAQIVSRTIELACKPNNSGHAIRFALIWAHSVPARKSGKQTQNLFLRIAKL